MVTKKEVGHPHPRLQAHLQARERPVLFRGTVDKSHIQFISLSHTSFKEILTFTLRKRERELIFICYLMAKVRMTASGFHGSIWDPGAPALTSYLPGHA